MNPRDGARIALRAQHASAVLVLVGMGREVALGRVEPGTGCGLSLIDDLLRLQIALRRFGWALRLDDVDPGLEELLELIGRRNQL